MHERARLSDLAAGGPGFSRLGFFTRLLDRADAAERYRLAIAQIVHAEHCGFDSAWVAQHHFHEDEGGLPAELVKKDRKEEQTEDHRP